MTLVAGTLVRRFGGLRISQVCCLISGLGMFASASGQIVLVITGCITVGAAYGMATPEQAMYSHESPRPGSEASSFPLNSRRLL